MITVLRAAEQRVVPWKNGLGTTREVAVDPPDGDVARGFRWRVSLATIDRDCPFSAFPGYDRLIALARGAGMTLVVDGRDFEMRAGTVVPFGGEAAAACRLHAGPVLDLNVMTDRSRARATLDIARSPRWPALLLPPGDDEVVLVIALEGRIAVRHASGRFELGDLDAARLDGPQPACGFDPIGAAATVAIARITLAGGG